MNHIAEALLALKQQEESSEETGQHSGSQYAPSTHAVGHHGEQSRHDRPPRQDRNRDRRRRGVRTASVNDIVYQGQVEPQDEDFAGGQYAYGQDDGRYSQQQDVHRGDAVNDGQQWYHGNYASYDQSGSQHPLMNMDQLSAAYAHNLDLNIAPSYNTYEDNDDAADETYTPAEDIADQRGYYTGGASASTPNLLPRVPKSKSKKHSRADSSQVPDFLANNPDRILNDQLSEGIPLTEAQAAELVSAPPPVLHASEYTLRVHPTFHYTHPNEMAYKYLSENQSLFLMDMIRQVRPFSANAIRKSLGARLRAKLAVEMLSGDEERVNSAIEKFYPRDTPKQKDLYTHDDWMTNLPDILRKSVIERLAERTQQSADGLRELFAAQDFGTDVPHELLTATDDEKYMVVVEKYGLYVGPTKKALPWQHGSSKIQRAAFYQRANNTGIKLNRLRALLQDPQIEEGYCLRMLRLDDQHFRAEIAKLKKNKR
ncbi:hypothetical protein CBS101457_000183 [Exobasidium rhododendri]|nr:hypothetical protein CBS101457_000183 [Exobasidium rhododendri]